MDIELIKWMVGYAYGFEWVEPDKIVMPFGTWTITNECWDEWSKTFLY